jgi:hypothetical protein
MSVAWWGLVLVTLAATLAVYPALWRGFGDQWPRIPPERRARAWRAMSLSLAAQAIIDVRRARKRRAEKT